MQQINTGVQEKIELSIYKNGVLTNADSTVTVKIYNADDTSNTIIESGSATNDPPLGIYSYSPSYSTVSLNRVLRIKWEYTISGSSTYSETFVEVSTPYATVSDIIDYYQLGTKPSDLNYKNINEVMYAARMAKKVIDSYTMQSFDKRHGTQEVFGIGSDAIELTEKMITLDKVWENGQMVIDNTVDPAFNSFGYPVELTPTGKAVRISNQIWDVRYDNQVDVNILEYGKFRNKVRYAFTGDIGWSYVPQDIKMCAILLAGDYLARDAAWRNKYLQEVSLSEISFKMHSGAFNGTGNLTVDSILDSYRNVGIVII